MQTKTDKDEKNTDKNEKSHHARKPSEAEDSTPKSVVPPSRTDTKERTQLYQRGPDERVWLTRDEARAEGFFWKDNPEEEAEAKKEKRA